MFNIYTEHEWIMQPTMEVCDPSSIEIVSLIMSVVCITKVLEPSALKKRPAVVFVIGPLIRRIRSMISVIDDIAQASGRGSFGFSSGRFGVGHLGILNMAKSLHLRADLAQNETAAAVGFFWLQQPDELRTEAKRLRKF